MLKRIRFFDFLLLFMTASFLLGGYVFPHQIEKKRAVNKILLFTDR